MVIEPMMLILNSCYLNQDQTSDNGYTGDLLLQSTLGTDYTQLKW